MKQVEVRGVVLFEILSLNTAGGMLRCGRPGCQDTTAAGTPHP